MKFIKDNIIYILLVGVHLYLLLQLIFFPYPELFIYSYLTDKGLLPYGQIFDQHFPGLMFLPVNFHSLGVDTIPEMRIVHLLLVVLTDAIFIMTVKKIFKKKAYMVTSLALYIFWQVYLEGHVLWIESLVTPLLLSAFYFLLRYLETKEVKHLSIMSSMFGIAVIFKQTTVPLVILVFLYLLFKKVRFKHLFLCGTITILPISLVIIYFYKLGVLPEFIYWTVTFNLTVFNEMGKTRPELFDLIKLIPSFGLALGYSVYLFVRKEKEIYKVLIIFLVGCLFFAFARFDYIHLQPALPFSIILLTMLFADIGKFLRHRLSSVVRIRLTAVHSLLFTVYCLLSLCIFIPNFRFNNRPGMSPMFNDPETLALIIKVKEYSDDGDTIFALGTYPHIYYLTGTMPPNGIFTFQFPWFMKVAENKVFKGIINDPPVVVIRDPDSEVGGYRLIEHMQNINVYIDDKYEQVDRVNGIEILVKKD